MEKGTIVKSVSGHDKNSFYVVVDVQGSTAYIADGRRRKVLKPKLKNVKHLQETNDIINGLDMETNKKLRRVLWEYNFASHSPVAK